MTTEVAFVDRRRKTTQRSMAEVLTVVGIFVSVAVSVFTGIRAFYVNEYRIDILESNVKETRMDIKETKNAVQELDRSVQRLVGAAAKQGWVK